jgi:hypothetical protein
MNQSFADAARSAFQFVESLGFSAALRMLDADALERVQPFQVSDENRLSPLLEKLAHETRAYALPAVEGDVTFSGAWMTSIPRRPRRSREDSSFDGPGVKPRWLGSSESSQKSQASTVQSSSS